MVNLWRGNRKLCTSLVGRNTFPPRLVHSKKTSKRACGLSLGSMEGGLAIKPLKYSFWVVLAGRSTFLWGCALESDWTSFSESPKGMDTQKLVQSHSTFNIKSTALKTTNPLYILLNNLLTYKILLLNN
jgi:hypothetical protein